GELSLAIVPYMTHDAPGGVGTELPADSTAPFSIDVAKPDVSSLTVTSAPTTTGLGDQTGSTTQPPTLSTGTSGTTSTAGGAGGVAQVPNLTAGPPPGTSTAPVTDAAPQVASSGSAQQSGALAPAAAGLPKIDNTAHNAALALLVLVAMA